MWPHPTSTGQVAAIARSHMNGSIPFKGKTEQTTEVMSLAPTQ